MSSIETDVLILGGGITGLWLLNDVVNRGLGAILLEKNELGGAQTCHSHVYVHQGHLYHEASLATVVKKVAEQWATMVCRNNLQPIETASHFGFTSPADAQQRADLWGRDDLQLPSQQLPRKAFPKALAGGAVRIVYESPEFCLDGEVLMRHLGSRVEQHIGAIADVTGFESRSKRIEAVRVALRSGASARIVPKVVVLCAGAENQVLLLLASGGSRGHLTSVQDQQQIRKAHMLVVRGAEKDLPPLTGVFPNIGGLFLVSRRLDGETVWLVSDDRSPTLGFVEDWMRFDTRWWFPRIWSSLGRLAPRFFGHPECLQWGIYDAPKAEGRATGSIPHEEKILKFAWDNLWAVWPTKLTLAPQVSSKLVDEMRSAGVVQPSSPVQPSNVWTSRRQFPGYAPERWKKTHLLDWTSFRKLHNLELA